MATTINIARPTRYVLTGVALIGVTLLILKEDEEQGNRTRQESKSVFILMACLSIAFLYFVSTLRK